MFIMRMIDKESQEGGREAQMKKIINKLHYNCKKLARITEVTITVRESPSQKKGMLRNHNFK